MTTAKFKFDRSNYGDLPLRATVTSDDVHGAFGGGGVGGARGLADGIIDINGNLKLPDGQPYPLTCARPGIDPVPPTHRLTVYDGVAPVAQVQFRPVLAEPNAAVLDINAAVMTGRAQVATPEQIKALALLSGEAKAAANAALPSANKVNAAITQAEKRSDEAVLSAKTAAAEAKAVVGIRAMGRKPQNGDEAGIYRFENVDYEWDGEQVVAHTPALLSADIFQLQRNEVPLRELSAADALGDMQQRVADAKRTGKPLDGAGAQIEVPLAGRTPLDLTGVTLSNVEMLVSGSYNPALVWDYSASVNTLNAAWSAPRGAKRLTIAAHGCRVGDTLLIYGAQAASKGRAYYRTGERRRVLDVVDANTVIVDSGLAYEYPDAETAEVRRVPRESGGGMRNVRLVHTGAGNRRGVHMRYAVGSLMDNVEFIGFRERAVYLQDCAGTVSGVRAHDGYYVGTGNSYGVSVTDLSDVDFIGCHISAGRHAIAGGGNYPTIYRVQGGSFQGGEFSQALDAHGNCYSVSISNAEINGGLSMSALHNRIVGCTVYSGISGGVYALDEAQAGSNLYVADSRLIKRAGAVDQPLLRLVRAWAEDGTTNAIPDERYGTVTLSNVDMEYHGSATTGSQAFEINASMERLSMHGVRIKRHSTAGAYRSTFAYNRIQHIAIEAATDGERIASVRAAPAAKGQPLLEAAPITAEFDVSVTGVDGSGALGALDLVAADGLRWRDLKVTLEAYDNGSLPLRARYADNLLLNQRSSGNAYSESTTASYRCGAWVGDVGTLTLAPTTCIDEAEARIGLSLFGDIGELNAPHGRIRGNLAAVNGTATGMRRGQLLEATGTAAWPTLAGNADTETEVAANSHAAFNVAVAGATVGDVAHIAPPAGLSAAVSYVARESSNGNVQVVVRNHSDAAVSISGKWQVRVTRT